MLRLFVDDKSVSGEIVLRDDAFHAYDFQFTASSSSAIIRFSNEGTPSGDRAAFLDAVKVTPYTGMVLVADVPGTTLANDAFWAVECLKIPSTARGITVDMGAVSVARPLTALCENSSHFSYPINASTYSVAARSIN